MKCYFTCFLFLVNINVFAQQVLWSSKILDFSSQFETNDYSTVKLLGPPDVPSDAGKHPAAWMAKSPDEREFLAVGFDSAINVRQIAIFESFNPGAIYKIYLYDDRNILHVIGTMDPKPVSSRERVMHILIDETPYKVNALRIIIDGSRVPGYNAIDAIAISNSGELIQKRKNFAYRTNPRLMTSEINLNAADNASDTRPVYSDKMKRLYFTRGYSSQNAGSKSDPGDIMVVLYSEANNSFTSPIYMGQEINNIGFNTSNGIVRDGDTEKLLIGNVTGNVTKVDPNIVLVGKDENGDWAMVEKQDIRKSGIYDLDADYHITADKKAMFLAVDRKNGEGGRDIFICFNNGNNKWSEPENLGPVLNTSGDEFAPFFSVAENALYFASRGHGGLGGSDIFRAIRLDDSYKSWSQPENIGPDINTEMDEKYFYFDETDESAFFARAKNETSYAIFRVERPRFLDPNPEVTLKGRVTGEQQPLAAAISLLTVPEDQLYAITFSDDITGLYNIRLRSGHDYKLLGESEGYKAEELLLSLENRQEPYSYDLDLKLSKELREESPELQDEIAGINEQIQKTTEETAPVVPSTQVTPTRTSETVKTGVAEQEVVDQQSKANKLASLPQTKDVKEPGQGAATVTGSVQVQPVTGTGKPPEETADNKPAQDKPVTSTGKSAEETTGTDTVQVLSDATAKPQEESTITRTESAEPGGSESKAPSGNTSIRSSKKTEVIADNLVRFGFNSIQFSSGTAVILDAIAEFLKRHELIRLEIGGFTDHLGDEMYNVELGKKRAQAVKNYLTGTGIAGNRIRIIGFGEKMPIVLSNDRDQLLTNRRVEFNFTR